MTWSLDVRNRRTEPTLVPWRDEIKLDMRRDVIRKSPLSVGCWSFQNGMGAAGFEPREDVPGCSLRCAAGLRLP